MTFDADANPVGWMAIVASEAAPATSMAARLAPAAEAVLDAEVSGGTPQQKALAGLTFLTAVAIWQAQQKVALDPNNVVNLPPPGFGEDPPPVLPPLGYPPLSDEERKWLGTPTPYPVAPPPPPPLVNPVPEQQDWRDLVVTKDARILGDNLEHDGIPMPGVGYQPHHIVPVSDPAFANLQQCLATAGIDINDSLNGIWLPHTDNVPNFGETPHNETFRDSYQDYLDQKFANVNCNDPADVALRLATVADELRKHIPTLPLKK